MKYKNLALWVFAFFALSSCDNTDAYFGDGDGPNLDLPSFTQLKEIVKFQNVPTDSLSFNPTEDSEVEGSFGTKFEIPANSIAANPSVEEMPEELFIILREYPTLTKMGLGNVQTTSDEKLLVTGGNFWWKVVDAEGNDYTLIDANGITVAQPIVLNMGAYANAASYFKGEVVQAESQEVLNWTLGGNQDSSMNAENNIFTYYGIDLGWVNCDAFYDYPGEKTQFKAMLNTEVNLQETEQMVLFVVQDFPSIVNLTTREGEYFKTYAESIPVGVNGALVGIALDAQGNLMMGSTNVTVAGDDEFTIDLTEGTITDFSNLLNQASN